MPKSLHWKLTLAFLLAALATAALVAFSIRVTSANLLYRLLLDQRRDSMVAGLVSYYSQAGSWNGIEKAWYRLQRDAGAYELTSIEEGNSPLDDPHMQGYSRQNWQRRSLFGLADAGGQVLVPISAGQSPGETLAPRVLRKGTAVMVDGVRVGTVLTSDRPPVFNPVEALFLRRTNQALLYAMLGALLVALLLGLLLARTLTRPLRALTQAAQNIAGGQLGQQVEVHSEDEIGQLAAAFNSMSSEVARGHQLRRQMTADIAHDLRTPLTVIGGYVESMRDGVLQPTPERLSLIYAEIERLQNLVGDLRMLSQADAGELRLNPQALAPRALLERAAELFAHNAAQGGVRLEVSAAQDLPEIHGDEARLMQVMDNLLSNSLRYTPPGGTISLGARRADGGVLLTVSDTGSGIDPAELAHIFDRFHRADKSRHAENGESGLGLAIVRALMDTHGGRVWAESRPGEGTRMNLWFPGRA